MNNTPDQKEGTYSDLCRNLPGSWVVDIEPQGDRAGELSEQRIRRLALEKRRQFMERNEETTVKKMPIRILLIAAAICLLSTTAFAAFGGVEYFRTIFGESAGAVSENIRSPQVKGEAQGRELALEAVLTDGYVTGLVVSLTGERPRQEMDLFHIDGSTAFQSTGWERMEEYSTAQKTFYHLELIGENRFESAQISLALNQEVAPIQLEFQVENTLGNCVVTFPQDAFQESYALRELQISPMGFLAIASEEQAKGGLPPLFVELRFFGGKVELLEVEFDSGEETVSGGGGAIIGGGSGPEPLVTFFQGRRNPAGEVITTGRFSRIINPDQIESVTVHGVSYPLR